MHHPATSTPEHSQTSRTLEELQLYGWRAGDDEPDNRPMPDGDQIAGAVADIFDALVAPLESTRLEPDLEEMLWHQVNLFQIRIGRIERQLDDNERAQRDSRECQDGSEIRSVELERLTAEGITLLERRNTMELYRDLAAEHFERHLHRPWLPKSGSKISHATMTAAMIDSRDFTAARRKADQELLVPPGPKIAVTGGTTFNDVDAIWSALDRIHAKHPDMILIHGGTETGAEKIAASWAANRRVTHIPFKPDWNRHGKSSPFKRNDAMLEVMPIGVLACPGNGIQANLVDKARSRGIPVMHIGGGA